MEVLSQSEALEIVQQSESNHSGINDGFRLKLAESNGDQSPTYMINRFLPDATALAVSSAVHFPLVLNKIVILAVILRLIYQGQLGTHMLLFQRVVAWNFCSFGV